MRAITLYVFAGFTGLFGAMCGAAAGIAIARHTGHAGIPALAGVLAQALAFAMLWLAEQPRLRRR